MFPALSDKTLALSEKVAHATMGIDALYRQKPVRKATGKVW